MAYFRLTEVKNVLEELDGWLTAQAADAAVAAMEACLSASAESDEGWDRQGSGVEIGHQWARPVVERRCPHMNQAYPKTWFDRMGLVSLLDTHRRFQSVS